MTSLTSVPPRMIPSSRWPQAVSLRRGWGRAEARPWNSDYDDAQLRLVRGGPGFLAACATTLRAAGSPRVISPPLLPGAQGLWRRAGFSPFVDLGLLRCDLPTGISRAEHQVTAAHPSDLTAIAEIDRAAFAPFWRLDELGLRDAIAATSDAEILTVGQGPSGYAIVGFGNALGYLQRIAVEPARQGEGLGRSLVRATLERARARGARAVLLNTQSDNERAIRLYQDEGFYLLPQGLALLADGPGAAR